MDFQKKFIMKPVESCPDWLKLTLWEELGHAVDKYRIAI